MGLGRNEDSSYDDYIAYVIWGFFSEHNRSIRIVSITNYFIALNVTSFHSRYKIYSRKTKLSLD
jgi:hypothetical protein